MSNERIESLEKAVDALTERVDELFDFLGYQEKKKAPLDPRILEALHAMLTKKNEVEWHDPA